MKTVEVKFVVEDDDASTLHTEIQRAMESGLSDFPVFCWNERESTKTEIKWKQKEDKHE